MVCTRNLGAQRVGSSCPSCGHTGWAHAPAQRDAECSICLAIEGSLERRAQ